jgi:VanZ family protein
MLKLIILLRPFAKYLLIIWALAILIVSSTPDIPTLKIHTAKSEFRLDYLIHTIEYGVLTFLTFLTFAGGDFLKGIKRKQLITVCLIVFAFADEFHQKFVPGRTYNLIDFLSNVIGIALAVAVALILFQQIRKHKK